MIALDKLLAIILAMIVLGITIFLFLFARGKTSEWSAMEEPVVVNSINGQCSENGQYTITLTVDMTYTKPITETINVHPLLEISGGKKIHDSRSKITFNQDNKKYNGNINYDIDETDIEYFPSGENITATLYLWQEDGCDFTFPMPKSNYNDFLDKCGENYLTATSAEIDVSACINWERTSKDCNGICNGSSAFPWNDEYLTNENQSCGVKINNIEYCYCAFDSVQTPPPTDINRKCMNFCDGYGLICDLDEMECGDDYIRLVNTNNQNKWIACDGTEQVT